MASVINLRRRLDLVERGYDKPGIPNVIVATRALPCAPDREAVKRWLAEGKAHIAFRGHAVFYDGGEKPLSVADWEAQYARQH